MPTLSIGDRSVQVDDSFLKLPQDQQNATVDEIAQSLGAKPSPGLLQSAETGAVRGVGGVGNLEQLIRSVPGQPIVNALLRSNPFTRPLSTMTAPTSQQVQAGAESLLGHALPEPQTPGEKIVAGGASAVTDPLSYLGPGGLLLKAGTAAASGAGSEIGGQLGGTPGRVIGGLLGGMSAASAPGVAARVVTPLPASAARQAAVDTLEQEGVNSLTAGQRTGSRPLQWFEQALGDLPMTGRGSANAAEQSAEQFTSAALRRVGEDAPRATPEVIDRAFNRIGNQFDTIAARNTVALDPQVQNDLLSHVIDYQGKVNPYMRSPVPENVMNSVAKWAGDQGGQLTGRQYQTTRSQLGAAARGATDPYLSHTLSEMTEALDDSMERTLQQAGNAQDVAAWQEARRQYRDMLVIERAATGPGENAAQGLISPAQLRTATVGQSRRAYARGQGDFADLSRAGEAVMRPLPQSGTAPRSYVQHLPSIIGAGAGGAIAGVPGALAGAAAAVAGPPLLGRLLMSRPVQAYLGNQAVRAPATPDRTAVLLRALLNSAQH